jgi:hypothetical protein
MFSVEINQIHKHRVLPDIIIGNIKTTEARFLHEKSRGQRLFIIAAIPEVYLISLSNSSPPKALKHFKTHTAKLLEHNRAGDRPLIGDESVIDEHPFRGRSRDLAMKRH